MTKLDALFAFCFWIAIGSAVAVLFSRIARLNDQPDHAPADHDSRLADVAHLSCERRTRGETRNGLGRVGMTSWLEWMDHTEDDFYDGPDLRRPHPPSEQDTAKRAPRDVGERPGRAQLDLGRPQGRGTGRPDRASTGGRAAWEASRPTRQERAARSSLRPRTGLVDVAPLTPPGSRKGRDAQR